MYASFREHLAEQLADIEAAGLTKHERLITTPQGAHVGVKQGEVLNLCANNYLGLAQHPRSECSRRAGAAGLGLWHGVGAVHLWHADSAQAA